MSMREIPNLDAMISANLQQEAAAVVVDGTPPPAVPAVQPSVEVPVATPVVVEQVLPVADLVIPTQDVAPVTEVQPDDLGSEKPADTELVKNLRKALREHKEASRATNEKLTETSTRVEKLLRGEEVPELYQALNNRVQELSKYEEVYNLQSSPAFKAQVIEPMQSAKDAMIAIVGEHGCTPDILDEVLELDTPKANAWMLEHFDELEAVELKRLHRQYKGFENQIKTAVTNPKEIYSKIHNEFEVSQALNKQKQLETITNTANASWGQVLNRIKQEGIVKELIFDPTDGDRNTKFVEPLLTKSAKHYGTFVNKLVEAGLTNLSLELATEIGKMVAYATSAETAAVTRDAALNLAKDTTETMAKYQSSFRPTPGYESANANPARPVNPVAVNSGDKGTDNMLNNITAGILREQGIVR